MNSSDEHDARCESELVLEAGMYTACDCKARQAHAHHEALSPLAPDCSYGGEASPPRQPSDHDRTVADGHTLTNTLRYACWLRSHDAEVAAAVRAEAVADERRRIDAEIRQAFPPSPRYMPRDTYNGMRDAFRVALDIVTAGSVPVATPEPDDSRITNQAGHAFTFTVELRGEGFNWSSTMVPQTVRAYDLPAAIAELSKVPFPAWFPDESDEVATPPAEPAARVTRESIERGAAAMRDAMAAPSQPWSDPDHDVAGDMRRAASGLSATPRPALCEHGSTGSHFESIASQRYGGWCPGTTCEHGQTKPHSFQKLSGGFHYGCPGPVSVPKESSE